jgi:exonuclease III
VAGLSTTAQRIHETYHAEAASSMSMEMTKPSSFTQKTSSLAYYMNRHQIDIFCLQEHKISLSQLSHRSEPVRCSSPDGYESFWSPTTPTGMNGVVTYARKGLTISATARPFTGEDDELNDQGRCIMTDHGEFCLFNVYAPCNGGHSVEDKMRFLHALRRAMKDCKKPVILVGDLNITHRGIDKYWKDRTDVIEDILDNTCTNTDEIWKQEVVKAWPRILSALQTQKVVPTETTNPITGAKYSRYRLLCTLPDTQQKIYLGKHESKPEYCQWSLHLMETTYVCPETGITKLSSKANTLSLSTLAELMAKIAGIVWDEQTLRTIADSIDGVCLQNPPRRWLDTITEEDNMIDVFRYLYPTARGRYTCWNQNTNRRYENEGCRIDYILISKSLVSRLDNNDDDVEKTNPISKLWSPNPAHDPLSEEAALSAATANGAYRPVSFEGGGIVDVEKPVLELQFRLPHTGMIYTPPSFSDHIAVSVVLKMESSNWGNQTLQNDRNTKRTQPHKSQLSISSFLQTGIKRTIETTTTTTPTVDNPKKKIQKGKTLSTEKANTILHHFMARK